MSLPNQSDIICNNCRSDSSMRYDYHEGTVLCTRCGLIAQNRFIDQTADYPIFIENRAEQTSNGTLGVQIENLQEPQNHEKSNKTSFKLTTFDRKEKKHGFGISKIKAWGSCLGLNGNVISAAIEKFQRLSDKKIRVGGKELAAMALLWGCKKEKHVLLAKAFENATGFKENGIWKIEKKIKKNKVKCEKSLKFEEKYDYVGEEGMGLKKTISSNCGTMKSSVYAVSFGNSLNLPFPIVRKIEEFAVKIENSGIFDGKNPKTIAGVAMVAVGQNRLKIKEIARVCEISVPTIKKTCKILTLHLKDLGLGEEEGCINDFLLSI